MGKLKKNEQGFSAIEIVLTIVVIALIGVVGWTLYKNHHKTTTLLAKTTTTKTVATVNPYAGWKTGMLQYEKLTYKYPSNWTVQNISTGATNCTPSPGDDNVNITSPDGTYIGISTGVGECGSEQGNGTILSSQKITTLGGNYFLNVVNNDQSAVPDPPYPVCVNTSASIANAPSSKNIKLTNSTNTPINSICFYDSSSANNTAETQQLPKGLLTDQYFSQAKLIIESLTYN